MDVKIKIVIGVVIALVLTGIGFIFFRPNVLKLGLTILGIVLGIAFVIFFPGE